MTRFPKKIQDFRAFEAAPGISVILLPDTPLYTHVAVSNDFIKISGMNRKDVIGKGHFELFPKSPDDPNFTGEQNLKASFAYILEHKQEHEIPVQRYDIPNGDGSFSQRYWKINNAPILSEAGEVLYIIHSAIDITQQIKAEQTAEAAKGIEKVYNLFMNAPVMISIVKGADHIIELANEGMLQVWGRDNNIIGKPLIQAIPELKEQGFIEMLDKVRKTSTPYHEYEKPVTLLRNGKEEVLFFDFVFQPYYENRNDKNATGVIGVAHDVTENVLARKQVGEVTERLNFRNALFEAQNDTTPDGVLIVDTKGKMLLHNKRFAEIWNMPPEIIARKDDEAALKHAMTMLVDPQGFIDRVTYLYEDGKEKSYDQILFTEGRTIERFGTPIISENGFYYGWAWYFRDITEQKKSVEALRQREEQFRTLANSITQLAWMADAEGWIYWYNERWFEYTGTTLEEMQGWGWGKVHHPDHIERVVAFVKEAWHKTETFELTFPLRGQDGKYRWFLTRVYPVQNNEGKVVHWIGTNTDIDEQKRNESLLEEKVIERTQELQNQTNLLDNILQNSSNGISVTEMIRDEQGHIIDAATVLANDAAVKFTGLSKDVYLSTTARELDPQILESPYGQTCLKTLETGEPSLIQYYLEMTERWLELTISRMDNDHLIHIFTDVTPIKEAQLQLERTVEELRRSNTNLEEFAYAASHDLKEPIRKIHFFSDRLKDALEDRLGEEEKRSFERMETASKRMSSLIDDLLTYSQVSLRPRTFEKVNLNQLIDLVLDDLDLEIEQNKAKIIVENLFSVYGHHRQLQQAFQNLIGNALKYSKPGILPYIQISGEIVQGKEFPIKSENHHKQYYLINIIDHGIGFEQKDVERIFNVFTRLHGNVDYRGTGVGLSIVRKVIENHDGFITAESQPGEGSTFKVYLPVK